MDSAHFSNEKFSWRVGPAHSPLQVLRLACGQASLCSFTWISLFFDAGNTVMVKRGPVAAGAAATDQGNPTNKIAKTRELIRFVRKLTIALSGAVKRAALNRVRLERVVRHHPTSFQPQTSQPLTRRAPLRFDGSTHLGDQSRHCRVAWRQSARRDVDFDQRNSEQGAV